MKSGYVSLLQNPAPYKNVKYVKSEYNALKLANEPLFSQLSELDSVDEFYEVQMHKRSHNHIIPTLFPLYLQMSKERALDLYHNFLSKYIKWEDWHPVCSDTDSAYIALSTESILKAFKPSFLSYME